MVVFLHLATYAKAALTSSLSIDNTDKQEAYQLSPDLNIIKNREKNETNLLTPDLAPIPRKEEVNPQKADDIKPSAELQSIINKVKNGTVLEYSSKHDNKTDYSVNKENLEIIKKGAHVKQATDFHPSPALEAVLRAYRNGSLNYAQRDIAEVEEELFYHQPYAEMDLTSIYDLIVLQTGKDVFLSLDYHDLRHNEKTEEKIKSRRIRDLEQTITAIKIKENNEQDEKIETPGEQHNSPPVKIKIVPKESFARKVLNILGIRRKDEVVDYEQLSVTYRAYKRWSKHIEDVDDMLRRKRKRKIQLIHQRRYRPSRQLNCGDPAYNGVCPEGQLKINPYKNGNIRFLKP